MAQSAVLCLAVLLAVFEFGSCLRCYQCNSETNKDCADPFPKGKYLVDCSTQDTVNYNSQYLRLLLPSDLINGVAGAPRYCHKIILKTGTTVRTCLDGSPSDISHTCRAIEQAGLKDATKLIKHCSVCDKDGCNAAGSITASLPLALLAVIASYFYCKQ